MLGFNLESPKCVTNVYYAGEGVVLISTFDKEAQEHDMLPFYFQDRSTAYEYIIKFTYTLMAEQQFKVVADDEENES
jgi:hypothetical protein